MAIRVRTRSAGSLILLLAIAGGTTVVWAQGGPAPVTAIAAAATAGAASAASPAAAPAAIVDPGAVRLMVGRSTILDVGSPITRVSLTSADVADAMVTAPGQILINGKLPGTISMFVWDKAGALKRYEVLVQRDLTRLTEQMAELFPGEKINVHSNGRNVVLSGQVTSKDVIEKAVNVAAGYVDKKEEVTPLLQVQSSGPPQQVLLRVRFAEVSRSAMTELGASIFTSPLGVNNNIGRITTQQFSAPNYEDLSATKVSSDFGSSVTKADGKITFNDFLNFFLFNQKYDLGVVVRALQEKGLFQSLAEPNLVAESGKDASFLAGGEFPVPVVQGSGAALAINVVFKEFGIRLNFTPTVDEGRVHLKVRPEVSSLDFNNAVTLQGFRIPALSTRRTETELELENGQTFAISGLLNNTVSSTLAKVPGIGDIPVLGYLFKSKAAQKNQTELVVMITPEILSRGSKGVTSDLPRGTEPYLGPIPEKNQLPVPPEAFESSRRSAAVPPSDPPAPAVNTADANGTTDSAAAVAALSALTPSPSRQMAEPGVTQPTTAPPPIADKPLTADEEKALERSKQEDEARARAHARVEAKAKAEEQRQAAEQAAAEKRAAELQKQRDEKAAREQARKDAEAKKKAEEDARRELARQVEQQRALDQAAAELKAAQARYDSVANGSK